MSEELYYIDIRYIYTSEKLYYLELPIHCTVLLLFSSTTVTAVAKSEEYSADDIQALYRLSKPAQIGKVSNF